jgi:hypothetical protein
VQVRAQLAAALRENGELEERLLQVAFESLSPTSEGEGAPGGGVGGGGRAGGEGAGGRAHRVGEGRRVEEVVTGGGGGAGTRCGRGAERFALFAC